MILLAVVLVSCVNAFPVDLVTASFIITCCIIVFNLLYAATVTVISAASMFDPPV